MSKLSDSAPKTVYKTHYYQIVLRARRAGGVTVQSSGTWIFAIVNLNGMVYRGYEYVQPCLYGRKTAKDAIFGGIQHYQVGLPYNAIIKRVYKAWCKQNPIDPKHKMKNELLWIYQKGFDGIKELIEDYPHYEKERRIEAAEEEAHEQMLIDSGYYDDMEDDDHEDDYEDFYYPDDF